MNKEMKETLNKVADYEEWVKQKALKAGNLAFASMFLISVGAIIIQLLLAVNLRLVLGETLIALVGGIVYAFLRGKVPTKYFVKRFYGVEDTCEIPQEEGKEWFHA